jgi:hypothetical protein
MYRLEKVFCKMMTAEGRRGNEGGGWLNEK